MKQIEEIIESVRNGDEAAFAVLMEKCNKVANRYIEKYRDMYPSIFEHSDLYQLALVSLYHSALNYDEGLGIPFVSYYIIILERDLLMTLREAMTYKNRSNVNVVSLDKRIAETEGIYIIDAIKNQNENFDPSKYIDKMELYQTIEKSLTLFSDTEANVFRMWLSGYSYAEIAERQKVNRKRVEYIIRKVRRNMRTSLWQWRDE